MGGDADPDFAASRYDSDSVTWADVHDELATRTLFGGDGPRIVVIDHADKFVKDNRERLEDYVNASSATGLLILIVDTWASNTRLYKAVEKSGLQIKCDPPTKSTAANKPTKGRSRIGWSHEPSQNMNSCFLPVVPRP